MDCPFSVGDEVVCVESATPNPNGTKWCPTQPMPAVGAVYKVCRLEPYPAYAEGWNVAVSLTEFPGLCGCGVPVVFPHGWFRRVEKPKRETSIEVFRKIDRDVFGKVPA